MAEELNKSAHSENDGSDNSRRDFLKIGLALGAGVVVGGGAIYEGYKGETKKIRVLTTDGHTLEINKPVVMEDYELKDSSELPLSDLQKRGRKGIPGKKWVMVIDLSKCRNARKCMDSCQAAHQLKPEQHHINVLRMQDDANTEPYFMPKPCYHCDNPPCTKVCPVDATFKREDGIVLIDNERCIGCRFCVAACPYSARVFHWSDPKFVEANALKEYDIELNVPQKKGTITKCLFSADRLRKGQQPYCVEACPNGVYWFGDLNEDVVTNGTSKDTVRFSDLIRENAGYTMMPELGTKPRVYYLPAKNRLFPFEYNGSKELSQEDQHWF